MLHLMTKAREVRVEHVGARCLVFVAYTPTRDALIPLNDRVSRGKGARAWDRSDQLQNIREKKIK